MLHLLHYPRELIAERVVFTPADQVQITFCRGAHNRLGFAYQMGFLRLTGRFPTQQPLEILDDLLAFVAHEWVQLNKRTETAIGGDDSEIVHFLWRFSSKKGIDIETICLAKQAGFCGVR
jgi:hypothetical protein